MRVFLDTNILLDVLMNRPGLVAESESAILRCEALGAQMFVAWHGLATAYYLLRRGRTELEAMLEVDAFWLGRRWPPQVTQKRAAPAPSASRISRMRCRRLPPKRAEPSGFSRAICPASRAARCPPSVQPIFSPASRSRLLKRTLKFFPPIPGWRARGRGGNLRQLYSAFFRLADFNAIFKSGDKSPIEKTEAYVRSRLLCLHMEHPVLNFHASSAWLLAPGAEKRSPRMSGNAASMKSPAQISVCNSMPDFLHASEHGYMSLPVAGLSPGLPRRQ